MKLKPGVSIAIAATAAGILGALVALVILLPLPPTTDIYAARRWGVGASYVGFFLGLPFTSLWVPLSVAIHPFPGDDPTGAAAEAAIVTAIVGVNWSCWAAATLVGIRLLRRKFRGASPLAPRPPA